MKIAISGKGGVGKTTLAGVMARILARSGRRVLAIDADPDSNLASAIGFSPEDLIQVKPLSLMEEFIAERTGAKKGTYGSFFKLNPKVDDIPDRFSLDRDGIKLVILGNVARGGTGCLCAENVLLKTFLSYVLIERDEVVIVDMEAGLEHLGRGTTEYVDGLIVVVEPGRRSFQTARDVERLGADLGIRRVYVVANKVTGEDDLALIRGSLPTMNVLGFLSYSDKVLDADRKGVSPFDTDQQLVKEVETILGALEKERA